MCVKRRAGRFPALPLTPAMSLGNGPEERGNIVPGLQVHTISPFALIG